MLFFSFLVSFGCWSTSDVHSATRAAAVLPTPGNATVTPHHLCLDVLKKHNPVLDVQYSYFFAIRIHEEPCGEMRTTLSPIWKLAGATEPFVEKLRAKESSSTNLGRIAFLTSCELSKLVS